MHLLHVDDVYSLYRDLPSFMASRRERPSLEWTLIAHPVVRALVPFVAFLFAFPRAENWISAFDCD